MRRQSLKNQLTGILYVPFIILLSYLTYAMPDKLMYFGLGSFLLLASLIAFAVLPVGKLRLGTSPPLVWSSWLIQIFLVQILMVILFVASILAFFSAGPLFAAQNLSFEAVSLAVEQHSWLLWSLFPWSAILIWAVCLGYYYHIRRAGPYPHQTCQDTLKNFIEPQTKAFVETNIFTTNMICIMATFAIAVLLTSYLIEIYFNMLPHTLGAPVTFMSLGFLVLLFMWRLSKHRLRKLEKRGFTSSGLLTLIYIGYVIGIVYSSYALQWLLNSSDQINLNQLQCNCQHFFDTTSTQGRLAAYYWGWGLLWTPMIGSYVVRISKGRSLRELIVGFTCLPLLITFIIFYKPEWVHQLALMWVKFFTPNTSNAFKAGLLLPFAAIALMTVRWMTFGQKNTHFLNAGFLDQQETYSAGRTKLKEGVKLYGFSRMGIPFLFASLSIISMHALGGWYLIQISVVLLAPVLMYFIYWSCVFIWVQFIQKGLLTTAKTN